MARAQGPVCGGRWCPANPDLRRTLCHRLAGREGRQVLGPPAWQPDLALELAPGLNQLALRVEEPGRPGAGPLLWLTDLRLEALPAAPALARK